VQWEIRSGITNVRGRGVVSVMGEETLEGMTGVKDILPQRGRRRRLGESGRIEYRAKSGGVHVLFPICCGGKRHRNTRQGTVRTPDVSGEIIRGATLVRARKLAIQVQRQ